MKHAWLIDVLAYTGAAAIATGCGMIYRPLGVIVAGAAAITVALLAARTANEPARQGTPPEAD